MTLEARAPELATGVAALLQREPKPWASMGASAEELLDFCAQQDLTGLVHRSLREHQSDWPPEVLGEVERAARLSATHEMLRRRELTETLDALESSGVGPILFKGTALAYSIYDAPDLRPRNDTDLLIKRHQIETVRRSLIERGYREPTYCDGELLFCQFELHKNDQFDLVHALDFHWKISTQTLFADLLTYDELAAESVAIPALGRNARGTGALHALLLACVHPVMHHRNDERLIWLHDIHLLASGLSRTEWARFATLALSKGVAAICRQELRSARVRLGTAVPDNVIERLSSTGTSEPTAAYLNPERRWHDELVSNVRGLKTWRDRARLVRETVFPRSSYMLKAYGRQETVLNRALLPLLYGHRGVRGVLKVLRGKK